MSSLSDEFVEALAINLRHLPGEVNKQASAGLEELLRAREALRLLASEERWCVTAKSGRDEDTLRLQKEMWEGDLQEGVIGVCQDAWKIARACLPEHQKERADVE